MKYDIKFYLNSSIQQITFKAIEKYWEGLQKTVSKHLEPRCNGGLRSTLRNLSKDDFERRTSTGRLLFASFDIGLILSKFSSKSSL